MAAYQAVLDAAQDLGFAPPPAGEEGKQQHLARLSAAQQLVHRASALHAKELRVQALAAQADSGRLADAAALAARAAGLGAAADTLASVAARKNSVADRLRSASTRPSVPVAPAHQPDFSALLCAAAGSAEQLHEGLSALQWAACLDARPSCWEDQLKGILDAAREGRCALAAMQELGAALAAAGGPDGGGESSGCVGPRGTGRGGGGGSGPPL